MNQQAKDRTLWQRLADLQWSKYARLPAPTSSYTVTRDLTQANGEPAIWTVIGDQRQLVAFDIRDGRIHAIYGVLNPGKLTHVSAREPLGGRHVDMT